MIWEVMDCSKLKYEDEFFDVIIDKSTLDCIVCCPDALEQVALTMKECQRTLKTGGFFISISFTPPGHRLPHLEQKFLDFDMRIHEIIKEHYSGELTYHYLYVMQKGPNSK